jgi:two-component system, chemotaxis family, chemotaxis protein CheY
MAARPRGCRALIVDDSRMIRRVSRQILEQLGYAVHEAENGQEALARCQASMPDAILLDWNMPVMTGLEFVTALRAAPGGAHPRVVFCTTVSGEPAIREALAGGADGYVVKPFTAQALEALLQRLSAG